MIITIDGPAGSGKSTLSRLLAQKLGFQFLDTGAMYRSVTLLFHRHGITAESNNEQIKSLLSGIRIGLDDETVTLNGENVSREIRTPEVDHGVSAVSAIREVRERMVELQRLTAAQGNFVAEGRDMGSVVFPQAEVKFYLDASPEERARRRMEQNKLKGLPSPDIEELKKEIMRRDEMDSHRALAPLTVPENAVIIDTTGLTVVQVLDTMLQTIREKTGKSF